MQRWIGSLVGRTIARSSAGRRTITITTPVRWLRSDRRFSTAAGTKQTKQTKQQTATATTSAKDKGGDPSIRDSLFTLCKHRGFVYPGSDIYGGLAASYDYGPLGVALKKNISDLWWRDFVVRRADCVGIDSSILLHPNVWSSAGHTQHFIDPLVECKSCHARHRADKFVENAGAVIKSSPQQLSDWLKEIGSYIQAHNLACPACGKKTFTDPKEFNLLFSTSYGPGGGQSATTYLRPETAQGIFINFPQLLNSTRKRLPFGVGQIGKSFRNEISPRDFLFRTREFTQMELEYFCTAESAPKHFDEWVKTCYEWLQSTIGLRAESLRLRPYDKAALAHYAAATTDIEFKFPFGWGELWGIANRADFDLKTHGESSGRDLRYRDDTITTPFYPHVIEPAVGLDRLVLAVLADAYHEEVVPTSAAATANPSAAVIGDTSGSGSGKGSGGSGSGGAGKSGAPVVDTRVVLKLRPDLAPYFFAVLPLSKKQPLIELSRTVCDAIRSGRFDAHSSNANAAAAALTRSVEYDETGSIGKRYRRFDEIGTPYCITVDFESLQDKSVTIRDRDSMKQRRLSITELFNRIQSNAIHKLFE